MCFIGSRGSCCHICHIAPDALWPPVVSPNLFLKIQNLRLVRHALYTRVFTSFSCSLSFAAMDGLWLVLGRRGSTQKSWDASADRKQVEEGPGSIILCCALKNKPKLQGYLNLSVPFGTQEHSLPPMINFQCDSKSTKNSTVLLKALSLRAVSSQRPAGINSLHLPEDVYKKTVMTRKCRVFQLLFFYKGSTGAT